MSEIKLKIVKFNEEIIELRQEVLHPGGPRSRVLYDSDDNKLSIHIVIEDKKSGLLLACGSLLPEDDEAQISNNKNRIRGMAVSPKAQGKGYGKIILNKMIEITTERNISYTWCNAREAVLPFYTRKGFVIVGDVFDIPGSGPHFKMVKLLNT